MPVSLSPDVAMFILSAPASWSPAVVVEEENELEGVAVSSIPFDKLGELESHLVRHRELFLSRQIETYKIDMVRYVPRHTHTHRVPHGSVL